MGSQNSTLAAHSRIDAVIPRHGYELSRGVNMSPSDFVTQMGPLFPPGTNDRGQFIHSLRILLSANGKLPLDDKRFRLVFSRAPEEFTVAGEEQEQIYVSLVAVGADGSIAARVSGDRAGTDNLEAFRLFRKTVEKRMYEMLETIPDASEAAASLSAAAAAAADTSNVSRTDPMAALAERNLSTSTLASTVLPDEPPSYQEANK